MKRWKTTMLKPCMLLATVFLIGAAVPASAKTAPKLSGKKITLKVGQKKKLKVKNVKKKKVKWSSKKKAVATVNKKGVVKAKKKGKTTIIAKVGKKKLKCKVVVKKADSKKKSNGKNSKKKDTSKISKKIKKQLPYGDDYMTFSCPEKIAVGKDLDFFKFIYGGGKMMPTPSDTIKTKYYKWYSSDSSIISFNKYGIATAHKTGKAKVYFKRMNKQGEWISSNVHTVEAINAGDVSFSFSYGFYKEWIADPEPVFHYNVDVNDPDAFNYVNVTVNNNSDTAITMDNEFDLYFNSWSTWKTTDNREVIVPAHTTITVLYHCNGMRRISEIEQISPTYTINGEKVYPVYDIARQVWEYQ